MKKKRHSSPLSGEMETPKKEQELETFTSSAPASASPALVHQSQLASFRPTWRLTCGLERLYSSISQTAADDLQKAEKHTVSPPPQESSALILGRYRRLRLLGSGAFAKMYLALDTYTSTHVAIKLLAPDNAQIARHEHALLIRLRRRNSKHFVRVFSLFSEAGEQQQEEGGGTGLVMELLDSATPLALPACEHAGVGHDLLSCPERIHELARLASQLFAGLHELHSLGFIHADLKPENILYVPHASQPGTVKIIDLGNAVAKQDLVLYHDDFEIQSLGYRAPEVILGDEGFDERVDIWSVGVILLELLVGDDLLLSSSSTSLSSSTTATHTEKRIVRGRTRQDVVALIERWFGSVECYKTTGKLWDHAFPLPHSPPPPPVIPALPVPPARPPTPSLRTYSTPSSIVKQELSSSSSTATSSLSATSSSSSVVAVEVVQPETPTNNAKSSPSPSQSLRRRRTTASTEKVMREYVKRRRRGRNSAGAAGTSPAKFSAKVTPKRPVKAFDFAAVEYEQSSPQASDRKNSLLGNGAGKPSTTRFDEPDDDDDDDDDEDEDDEFEAAIIRRGKGSASPSPAQDADEQPIVAHIKSEQQQQQQPLLLPPLQPPPPPPKIERLLRDPRRRDLAQFMFRLLSVDFKQRPTAAQVLRDRFLVGEVLGVWGEVLLGDEKLG